MPDASEIKVSNEEIDETLEAFDAFVRETPDSPDHIVRQGSNLTGAQLHFARRLIEDLLVDYEATFTPGAEFEASANDPFRT